MSKKKTHEDIDPKIAARALEYLFASGYINKKRLYFENFLRGIFFSIGSVLGATVVIALILWLLSLLGDLPFIGDIVRSIERSIQEK